jgi:hypothetical protein
MTITRYRIYREHKFVTYTITEFTRFVSKVDFSLNANVYEVIERFNGVKGLMHGHAEHENSRIHVLLRKKKSTVHLETESDHANHDNVFKSLDLILAQILEITDSDLKCELGHRFYLEVQHFEAENLRHQFYEETVIMPELQKLYSDDEILNEVDGHVYEIMTADQMVEMMQVLFPHFNKSDREAFLRDIKHSQPMKFSKVWDGITSLIEENERTYFISKLKIVSNDLNQGLKHKL